MEDKPNAAIIELEAVNILKRCFNRTKRVYPDIKDNDKTPSWDGDLYLYKTCGVFTNNNLEGRIPVQVKGSWVKRFPKGKAKFPVDMSDLQNYKNDGGVLFFLVLMKDFDDFMIFYDALLPFDLQRLVDDAKNQKSKTISLSVFNHKYINGITNILYSFLTNRERQGKLLPGVSCVEDLTKYHIPVETLRFSITSDSIFNINELETEMLSHPLYIYAKPENLEAEFVVEKVEFRKLARVQNTSVIVNGTVLYNHIEVVRTPDGGEEIRFGKYLSFKHDNGRTIFSRNPGGTLCEQINDIKFTLALAKGEEIKIGKATIRGSNFRMNAGGIQSLNQQLQAFTNVKKTLDSLNVKKDLDIGLLSKEEFQSLNHLVDGILYGKAVPLTKNGSECFGKLRIGNLTIFLDSRKEPSGNGYYIRDFFKNNFHPNPILLARDGQSAQDGRPISPYMILDSDSLLVADNVDLKKVPKSVKGYKYFPLYGERIIWFILDLLNYYDLQVQKDNSILDVARPCLKNIISSSK